MINEQCGTAGQRCLRLFVTVIAACLTLLGLISKILIFQQGHWLHAGGAIIFYLLMFFLFIFRYSTQESSAKGIHWLFALSGTLLPLALKMEKTDQLRHTLTWVSIPIEVLGMVLSIIAIYTLGRSFGIIAAKRQIKTNGIYKIIRHPLYAGEALWFFAIVLQNLSVFNILLFGLQALCQLKRIVEEEAVLKTDASYRTYSQEVPWRLIPGLF